MPFQFIDPPATDRAAPGVTRATGNPQEEPKMSFDFIRPSLTELRPRITVFGVGGAGGNAVSNMISDGLTGVDFVVANTDAQALAGSPAETRIQLGLRITQGLGAGARPEIGAAAAEEAMEQIDQALDGCHMCFITAGMGGGTGTGAAPVVARAARERGVLTVGVVTKPFAFEGLKRMRMAEAGITELQRHVDTLIIIPNQNLFLIANQQTTFRQAFQMADEVLNQGVKGITDLMTLPGLINLDFADVRTVMSEMGRAMMGTGEASGERRAIEAAEKAVANPLLDEVSLRGAKAVIINITGGDDLGLMEVEEAAQHIREMVDPDANIIVGSAFNDDLEGKIRISVVATGIEGQQGIIPGLAAEAALPRATTPSLGVPTVGLGAPVRPLMPGPSMGTAALGGLGVAAPGAGELPPDDPTTPKGGPGGLPPRPGGSGPGTESIRNLVSDLRAAQSLRAELADDEADLDPDLGQTAGIEAAAEDPLVEDTPLETEGSNVAELPLDLPEPVEVDATETDTEVVEDTGPERRPTLFERLLNRSRPPKAEPGPVETLAPEPEEAEDARDDPTVIPPFFRRQSN
jgi:cell division protein FtsZ